MNGDTKLFIMMGFAIVAMVFTFYTAYINDLPVKAEGTVIGTFVEPSGWSSHTVCIVEVDGERLNTYRTCGYIIGDEVIVDKYKSRILIRGLA